jgi:hypothetical protein
MAQGYISDLEGEGMRHCYTVIRTGNTSLRSILYAMIIAAHGDRCVAVYNIRTMGLYNSEANERL